jgi:fatty acid desaturase
MEFFALIILLVLVITALLAWTILGMLPGKIARDRNHPQADAISVCGWWGAITLGILSPLAFVWAFTNPTCSPTGCAIEGAPDRGRGDDGAEAEAGS